MEPSYYRGQSETFIGLHSFHYPAVQAKSDELFAQSKELASQVEDQSASDDVKYDIMMLGQGGLMMGADTLACSAQQKNAPSCLMR